MAHVRKLLLTLASGSALYSGLVPALGLGGITLHSALNQPLEADIELLQMGDLDSGDIRVRLASEADFARSGVDRLFFSTTCALPRCCVAIAISSGWFPASRCRSLT